jgi:hypothetical protein
LIAIKLIGGFKSLKYVTVGSMLIKKLLKKTSSLNGVEHTARSSYPKQFLHNTSYGNPWGNPENDLQKNHGGFSVCQFTGGYELF